MSEQVNEQQAPSKEQVIAFMEEQIEVKEIQLKLQELNTKLGSQVTELTSKNSNLWFELQQEKSYIDKGRKVTWLDKQGETNEGIVLDDYTLKDKVYVVVIRMKDEKTQGAPISIPFTKLTVI